MKQAIREIKNLIQYYCIQRDTNLAFFQSERFQANIIGDNKFVIEHTEKIYGELIEELKTALEIIETVDRIQESSINCHSCEGKGYVEYYTGVEHEGCKEIAKEPCDCQNMEDDANEDENVENKE